MRAFFLLIFLTTHFSFLAQKKALKKIETDAKQIEISTVGLDDFSIENSDSDFIEIFLYAQNPNEQHIVVDDKKYILEIKFKIPVFDDEDKIFRKFITKRLKRARATIKIPKNKEVLIFGDEINILSKSYKGNLRIFIENGTVKLDTIQQNLELKLYEGSVFGKFFKSNLNLSSKTGKIKINEDFFEKKYQKKELTQTKEISIITQRANIFLSNE